MESQVATLREALKGSDVPPIESGMQTLVETLSRVSTAAYQAASSSSDGNGSSGEPSDSTEEPASDGEAAGDETVEGEFKEV